MSFQNCSGAKFSSTATDDSAANTPAGATGGAGTTTGTGTGIGTDGGGNTSPPCHDFTDVTLPIKIILIVDNSGSTSSTDPNQAFRQSSIREFLTNVSSRTGFSYTFEYFSDVSNSRNGSTPAATALINNGNNQDPTFGAASALTAALNVYATIPAGGDTNYQAALAMAQSAIQNDPDFQQNPTTTNYAILFMSDGMPTDANGNHLDSPADDAALLATVSNIVNLSPRHVALSTVYFDSATLAEVQQNPSLADADAIPRLQNMAITGGGQFANTLVEGVDNMDLQKVITLPAAVCN